MEVLSGYPTKAIFRTGLGHLITVSCGKDVINIEYLTKAKGKTEKTNYFVKETKQTKLVMNK